MANIYVYSAAAGAGTGVDWTNAYTTLQAAAAAGAAGDTFFVAHDHAQTAAAAVTATFPGTVTLPNKVYSVNRAIASPGASDLLAGAQMTTTGNNAMNINGCAEFFGIRFKVADGTNAPGLTLCGTANTRQVYRQCIVDFTATTGVQACFIGVNTSQTPTEVLWTDSCQFLTGVATQAITPRNTRFTWENSASPVTSGANGSRNVIGAITNLTGSVITLRGLDFSALAAGGGVVIQRLAPDQILIEECRLPTNVIYSGVTPDVVTNSGFVVNVLRCASAAGVNYDMRRYVDAGAVLTSALVTRTNGASDGTTSFSWQIASSAEANKTLPLEGPTTAEWNSATGAAVTVTLQGISNTAAIPTNADLWIEVSALTNATYPLRSMVRSGVANGLSTPAAYSASAATWGATAPLRANSTAYALGDPIQVASNPGRVFFCTTAGTASGTEPAGYATAVDGGSVTDGGATFRAGWRFSMAASITPQMAGLIQARIQAGAASASFFVDPALTIA